MNIIEVKLKRRIGNLRVGQVVKAELKTHGVVVKDNEGMSRVLGHGDYYVTNVPKPLKISLFKARELSGRYVKDITRDSGRSRTSLFSYENGTRQVPENVKEKYAAALYMKVEWIEWDMEKNREHYNKTNSKLKNKAPGESAKKEVEKKTRKFTPKITPKDVSEVLKVKNTQHDNESAVLLNELNQRIKYQELESERIDIEISKLEKILIEHTDVYNENAEIYNKNSAYSFEKFDTLDDSIRSMNERMKKLEEYIIDIETELSEYKDILKNYNHLPWYKKPFTKIKLDQGE